MSYYKGKTEGQLDWDHINKPLSLATINRVFADLKDGVLRDVNEKQTAAEKAGGRFLMEKALTPSEVMEIAQARLEQMRLALEPAEPKAIESSE